MRKTIIISTGAGISADSGISTFRDSDGLWEKHKVEDVATLSGFNRNPQLVWDFYKARHDQLFSVKPNDAHIAISKFQTRAENLGYNVVLLTQNVDRLHHAAGSINAHEIHGNLHDVKCSFCDFVDDTQKYWESIEIPECPKCQALLRPNIVWFGEMPDQNAYYAVSDKIVDCAVLLVVGTSCQVQPAAGLVYRAAQLRAHVYECNLERAIFNAYDNYHMRRGRASITVPEVCNTIYNKLLSGSIESSYF